jgi:hypothetical protein
MVFSGLLSTMNVWVNKMSKQMIEKGYSTTLIQNIIATQENEIVSLKK